MKKVLLSLGLVLAGLTATAQDKGDIKIGGGVSYLTEGEGIFGLNLKGSYSFTPQIRAAASFNYLFPGNSVKAFIVDANAHYLVNASEKFSFYPLAGLAYYRMWLDSFSYSKLGFNVGAGVDYKLNESLTLNLEGKYLLLEKGASTPVISAGVAFSL